MEGNQEIDENDAYVEDEISEEDLEYQEEGGDLIGSEPTPLGGIYALFKDVKNSPRSTKVSNLNKEELGDLGISVRESMRIALLAKSFGHVKFANFFLNQAGIVSDSAMSKDGWFTELIVTSKKYTTRESSSNVKTLPQFNKKKWKMFSAKKAESQ